VAEQNSVDLAWNLFMDERFSDLRHALCPTDGEMRRSASLSSTVATDIMDRTSRLSAMVVGKGLPGISQ
jgi:hypothetical protein